MSASSHERRPVVVDASDPEQVAYAEVYGFNQDPANGGTFGLQGGVVILDYYGCHNCGHAFWTEGDPTRRLEPGLHPCPHCGQQSEVVAC